MTENVLLIVLTGLGITLLASVTTLVIVAAAWREVRRISYALDQRYSRLDNELERARFEHSEAKQQVRRLEEQLEEERPEKLTWELQHVTEELERLRSGYSDTQRQIGQQKQEWLHQAEQQEQQRLRLEQERQHLMEELERWRERYVEARQQAERLGQERSDAQQKVEQLTELRKRLLAEVEKLKE